MTILRVALAIDLTLHYFRSVLLGIREYAATKPQWIFLPMSMKAEHMRGLRAIRPDGVIAQVLSPEFVAPLRTLRRPVVNVSRALTGLPFPRVGTDEGRVGQVAAAHLLSCGYRNFGFIGHMGHYHAVERSSHFRRALRSAGHSLACYDVPPEMTLASETSPWTLERKLLKWLQALPKPVAIFAVNDQTGLQLLEFCREADLRVPEDVAVVGVDNDHLLCELARPSLSSVALPGEMVGYEAAALLDRLMQGQRTRRREFKLPPVGLVVRQSSNPLALKDEDVASALRFIHEHVHQPLCVADILRHVPVSRRSLERRFQETMQRTIGQEIRRVHLERAKDLLANTDLSIAQVAEHAGYSTGKHLCTVVRQETGVTPSAYRRQFRRRTRQI